MNLIFFDYFLPGMRYYKIKNKNFGHNVVCQRLIMTVDDSDLRNRSYCREVDYKNDSKKYIVGNALPTGNKLYLSLEDESQQSC